MDLNLSSDFTFRRTSQIQKVQLIKMETTFRNTLLCNFTEFLFSKSLILEFFLYLECFTLQMIFSIFFLVYNDDGLYGWFIW